MKESSLNTLVKKVKKTPINDKSYRTSRIFGTSSIFW